MMRAKTHPYEYERDGGDVSPLPDFSKSPLIITKEMISKAAQKRKKGKKSSALSSSSGISRSDRMIIINRNNSNSKPRNLKLSSSLGSLMAAVPSSTSPVCSSPSESETIFSSPSSNLPCDYSRASGDFYTPIHQSSSVLSSMSFRKQEQSPKCLSISTIYESVTDHNHRGGAFDSHGYAPRATYTYSPKNLAGLLPRHHHDHDSSTTTTTTSSGHVAVLPSVPEEMAGHGQRRRESGRAGQFTRAIPVRTDQDVVVEEEEEEHPTPVNRPKPYNEFLVEVQSHRRNAERSARRKPVYTRLFDQLRRKEAAIDDWESKQKNEDEFQLDKLERKLEKKRAKAVQKMHQKVEEINVEAERRKAKARRSFLKKMDRLSGQNQDNKARVPMFFHVWSCCCIPISDEYP